MVSVFDRELRVARFFPPLSYGPRSAGLLRRLKAKPVPPGPGISVEEVVVPGPAGGPQVSMRVFRPTDVTGPVPALLWVHGGGLIIGEPEQDDLSNIGFVRELGIVVAAVRYRLAHQVRGPAAAEDVYAALLGLVAQADRLGVDVDRIAVGGASAGGGVAAAAVLLAHDRDQVRPVFQLLVYPMLDDRTVTRTDMDTRHVRVWTAKSNRFAWTSYLGGEPGGPDVSPYSAPARREDLSGLPAAWIGVGSLDLFRDEDVTYAGRLTAAGVACELQIVPGAFHGFDALFRKTGVARRFWEHQAAALRGALLP